MNEESLIRGSGVNELMKQKSETFWNFLGLNAQSNASTKIVKIRQALDLGSMLRHYNRALEVFRLPAQRAQIMLY